MRGLLTFAGVMTVGAAVASQVRRATPSFGAGYATGVGYMLAASILLNTIAGRRA